MGFWARLYVIPKFSLILRYRDITLPLPFENRNLDPITMAKFSPNSLTFEIDGPRITAQRFRKGFNAFLQMADEVADSVAGKPHAVEWLLSVEPGSVRVHIAPEAIKISPEKIPVAIDAIQTGLAALEVGDDIWPKHFSEKALEAAKTMGEVLSKSDGELSAVQVRYNGQATKMSSRSIASVDQLLQGKYVDHGTVEGRIQVLSRRGKTRFSIDDDISGRNINCYFPSKLWDDVLRSFDPKTERRVSVSGLIQYRCNGTPINITVEEFRVLRPKNELPSWSDVLGILSE